MNSFNVAALCLLLSLVSAVPAKVAINGKCPSVAFVDDFDSTKFIDKWFAIKETGKEIPCVTYELEERSTNHFHAYLQPQNATIELDKKNVESFSDGLSVQMEGNPYISDGELKVFDTDYENFAGIFICKYDAVDDVHYELISYWSRLRTLSDVHLTKLSEKLVNYDLVAFSHLKDVKQDDCDV